MASAPCSTSSAARVLRSAAAVAGTKKMMCLCSPTNHPGSFRCSRHRNGPAAPGGGGEAVHGASSRGGTGRAAKGRSVRALLLQRIGGGPGELGCRRRGVGDFQPRPSRLRLMNL
ncbi:uncharacterized protein [Miscanthus floridulus]|uniref:uncharacterized protein n=1 Tax=Miscanthus floridulus TaxID=154761 RepID=UPI00345802D0